MISVIMVCSLTACGQQETGIMTKTGNSTEQVVASGDNSELATAEDNNMEQTEAKEQEVVYSSRMNRQWIIQVHQLKNSRIRIIGRMSKNWLIKGVMRLRSIYWQISF